MPTCERGVAESAVFNPKPSTEPQACSPEPQGPKCSAPPRTFFPWALSLKPDISFEASLRLGRLGSLEALSPSSSMLSVLPRVHDPKRRWEGQAVRGAASGSL